MAGINSDGYTDPIQETRGGTNQSSFTQGDTLYASAANTLSKLAKDANATRYLSNQGSSNSPSWNQVNLTNGVTGVLPSANGGLWVLIQSQSASASASIVFTSGIATYKRFLLVYDNVVAASGGGQAGRLRYSTDGGSSYVATGYSGNGAYALSSAAASTTGNVTTYVPFSSITGTGATSGVCGQCMLTNVLYTNSQIAGYTAVVGGSVRGDSGYEIMSGLLGNSAAINALQITMASGNITSGRFTLYGLADS